MALIKCSECGHDVSDKATTCPNCGAPVVLETIKNTKINIIRFHNDYFTGINVNVYVDGEYKVTIGDAFDATIEVEKGFHNISFNLNDNEVENLSIQADEKTYVIKLKVISDNEISIISTEEIDENKPIIPKSNTKLKRVCPRCGGEMQIQTVVEARSGGFLTFLGYFLLCITILGIFILIPLLLRKKTETNTYAVCQNCGYKKIL